MIHGCGRIGVALLFSFGLVVFGISNTLPLQVVQANNSTSKKIKGLLKKLRHPRKRVRARVVKALSRFPKHAKMIAPFLLKALEDRSWWVRSAAAKGLVKLGPAVTPILSGGLQNKNWKVRMYTAKCLGQLKTITKQANSSLIRALKDSEPRVRIHVYLALLKIHPDAPKPKLTLKNANLEGSYFQGEDLSDLDLSRANLKKTNLKKVQFINAKLTMADLSHANLQGALLFSADLSGAKLHKTLLKGAKFNPYTKWPLDFNPIKKGAEYWVKGKRMRWVKRTNHRKKMSQPLRCKTTKVQVVKGKKEGKEWVCTSRGDWLKKGQWKDGKRVGMWILSNTKDNTRTTGSYVKGKKHGRWIRMVQGENSRIAEGDGSLHIKGIGYHGSSVRDSGKNWKIWHYQNGKLHGRVIQNEMESEDSFEGRRSVCTYKNGQLHGVCTVWSLFSTGDRGVVTTGRAGVFPHTLKLHVVLIERSSWSKGNAHGKWIYWKINDEVKSGVASYTRWKSRFGRFSNDVRCGFWYMKKPKAPGREDKRIGCKKVRKGMLCPPCGKKKSRK